MNILGAFFKILGSLSHFLVCFILSLFSPGTRPWGGVVGWVFVGGKMLRSKIERCSMEDVDQKREFETHFDSIVLARHVENHESRLFDV